MSDRTNHVTSTFWGCVQNSNVVTAGGDVQLTLANGAVLSVRQEDWVDFSDLITKVTQRLVGRGFVFEKVADFIQSNPRGYFRVIADAGLGKTAIAAELTKRFDAVACFISASENRTQPERIINILSTQLIARYALPYDSLPVRAGETSDWFYQRLREAASKPENRPVVVIIDAIDEADAPAPTRNWLHLPRDLPPGVYIILTHRPGDYLLTTVPNLPSSEQVISWDDPKQQSDIEMHLRRQAEQAEIRQLLEKTTSSISVNEFVSELQKSSQGNFMYLEYVLADILAGNSGFNPLNLQALPQGLRGYYAQFWSGMEAVRYKEGWQDWNSLYCPVIELLGVALESVSVQWLADQIRRDANEIRVRALQSWQRFLSQNQRESIETWRLVHQSFANFLEEKVDLTASHRRVVEYYLTQREPQKKHGGYADRHLSTHLTLANLWDEFANRIDSHHWLKPDSLEAIIDRIAKGINTESDFAALRRQLTASSKQQAIQLGKYNVNIAEGQDIHIGDRIYNQWDEQAIQALVQAIQSSAEVQEIQIGDRIYQGVNAIAIGDLFREALNLVVKPIRFILSKLSISELLEFLQGRRPGNRQGGGSRDFGLEKAQDKYLTALVPQVNLGTEETPFVIGLTVSERPTFWFYVPYQPIPPRNVRFVLFDEEEDDVYEATFQFNNTPGIVSISLPETVTPLEIGQNYRWIFSFISNPRNRSADDVVTGWVKRILKDPDLKSQLESVTTQRESILLYAANGLWYDAISALAQLRCSQPQDETIQTDWYNLLQSVDLGDIASEPIVS
ncbi:DUF928 domain-containing protein [Nostoc sp. 'Peltigera membranacea cyanobiont' N6]|uniref:DUF928 domain-containing protein n=1 Tax=Nostoc sp. 'Peltigera membranacea cyanobiont' N6 TaxID=1261031 RepID=UPI000CF2FF51|nr:DUF928 domain-containing protein [Nostoc sp. 'Peltigera membranacea cyanobiont' N6]AVH63771.1 protein of unknown function DUF928 [Nostoc sp. 'Peltigera membranacea cyanobiont' N6]